MNRKGRVFNIQKFSIHDGPGIRTTVFLKGCPLRCAWCANPESQNTEIQLLWDRDKCTRCGCCVKARPQSALSFVNDMLQIAENAGDYAVYAAACPVHALLPDAKEYTAAEILAVCKQDIDFYEESGGGVTLSGGEPFAQFDFFLALLKLLKEAGIHTTVETTGFVKEEQLLEAAPCIDLFLYDVKHYEAKAHTQGTGVSNVNILQNLTLLQEQGFSVLPRIPVIPGFNRSAEDAAGFGRLFQTLQIKKVQLLPFHQFGQKKYMLLSKQYAYKEKKALYPEDLEGYRRVFEKYGIDAYL